jgi:hypothetical protein
MADVARCTCPKDSAGTKCGRNLDCAFHGINPADPIKPYALTENDKRFLRTQKIAPFGSEEIQQIRQADEDRFKERN